MYQQRHKTFNCWKSYRSEKN